jgi:hypothetical protein
MYIHMYKHIYIPVCDPRLHTTDQPIHMNMYVYTYIIYMDDS